MAAPVPAAHPTLRIRPEQEQEICTWMAPSGNEVRLRSLNSDSVSSLLFCNASSRPAQAVWLNFQGDEVAYPIIPPIGSNPAESRVRYLTFQTHPWIMRDEESGERLMVNGRMVVYAGEQQSEQQPPSVTITQAPLLTWTIFSHRAFPAPFKAAARALLLAHHRLRNCDSPGIRPRALDSPGAHDGISTRTRSKAPMLCSLMGLVDIRGSPPPRAPAGAAAIAAGICRAALCYLQPPMMVCGSAASATSSPPSPPSPSSSSSSSSSGRGRLRCSYGLSLLSTELVIHILSLAAPSLRQCVTLGPAGHPDVLPALLPSDPATWGPPPALPAPPPPPAPL